MNNLIQESIFFGVAISLLGYEIGLFAKKKLKKAIFNPLLISVIVIILFLCIFQIDYKTYNSGAKYLSYLLTPATVCLAVPLYEQIQLLKKNAKAVYTKYTRFAADRDLEMRLISPAEHKALMKELFGKRI